MASIPFDVEATVAAARTGDEAAFARIVAIHADDMARVAYLVCGDVPIAHEAVQSAWAIAWRRLASLREVERLRPWLVSIAANEARGLLRTRRRRHVVEIDVAAMPGPDARTDPDNRRDDLLDLRAAMGRLAEEDRAIVAMRYLLGLTSDEIAAATGRSAVGVRTRLMRALRVLRTELDGG